MPQSSIASWVIAGCCALAALLACGNDTPPGEHCAGVDGSFELTGYSCNGNSVGAPEITLSINPDCTGTETIAVTTSCSQVLVLGVIVSGNTIVNTVQSISCSGTCDVQDCTLDPAPINLIASSTFVRSGSTTTFTRPITQTDVDNELTGCDVGEEEVAVFREM